MRAQWIKMAVVSAILLTSFTVIGSAAEKPGQTVLTKKEAKVLLVKAKTSEDHLKLAAYFRNEAQRQEAKARSHEEMAEWYRYRPLPNDSKMPLTQRMQYHCKYFADEARKAAASANATAADHENAADQLRTAASAAL